MKVHIMLVIGERDLEAGSIPVRVHGKATSAASARGSRGRPARGDQRAPGVVQPLEGGLSPGTQNVG